METKELVEDVLKYEYFWGDDAAIPYTWVPSEAQTPLVVVTGENASGKSFFRRVVQSYNQHRGVENIHISMEGRRSISSNPLLVFIYGDEEIDATGVNSIKTVLSGIKTCQGRTIR